MRLRLFYLLCIAVVLAGAHSCKPIDPCLKEEEFSIRVGDTVYVKSCSKNAEIYSWEVDKEPINRYLNPPGPFFSHYADSGGGPCSGFVFLIFHDTGSFNVRCGMGKVRSGGCSKEAEMQKVEFLSALVHVRDTAKRDSL